MKVGLVGFAGSGKTTVFNAMTGLSVPVGFGGEVRLGTVKAPDQRIDTLSRIFSPKKTTYAEISFCDIPGEHGAEKKGLSTKGLEQIRNQEVLCLVLRDFENPALDAAPNSLGDLEGSMPSAALKGYSLLIDRPLMVVLNRREEDAANPMPDELARRLTEIQAEGFVLSASVEAEIATMDPADQAAFLADLGLSESSLARFIRTAYHLMDLISFFTVGSDEVRAWTIKRGTRAREAAGRIHSDLERGFIRAEVIPYDVFIKYGTEHAVREAGHHKVEGKDYAVADGDIMHVRFNV